jgi:hypothetical protein
MHGICILPNQLPSNFTSMANTPTYILYHGRNTSKDKDSKKIWTRIGAVWPNKSGKGFNISWDYLPLGDGVTVMLPFDKDGGEIAPPDVERELYAGAINLLLKS